MAKKILLVALMVLLGSTAAWAGLITSVDQLPAGAYDFINFDSKTLSTQASGSGDSLAITSGTNTVTFTGMNGQFRIDNTDSGSYNATGHYLDNGPYTGYGVNGNSTLYMTGPGFNELKISFLSPVEAFGFNMGAIDNYWLLTSYDVKNKQIESRPFPINPSNLFNIAPPDGTHPTTTGNTGEFYGLKSSSRNISYVYLTNTGDSLPHSGAYGGGPGVDWVFIDNFQSSDPPPAPIPGSFWLLGSGLAALAGLRVRRVQAFCLKTLVRRKF